MAQKKICIRLTITTTIDATGDTAGVRNLNVICGIERESARISDILTPLVVRDASAEFYTKL